MTVGSTLQAESVAKTRKCEELSRECAILLTFQILPSSSFSCFPIALFFAGPTKAKLHPPVPRSAEQHHAPETTMTAQWMRYDGQFTPVLGRNQAIGRRAPKCISRKYAI